MYRVNQNKTVKQMRRSRVRGKLVGTATRPRLCVLRSNKRIHVQAIDDIAGKTIASASDMTTKLGSATKSERAAAVGTAIAQALKAKKISAAIFDRGSYKYHGRVKAVSQAVQEAGITI